MNQPPKYCLFFIQHWSTCLQKGEWAAWAQAVLSALAILAAVLIGNRQHRKQLESIHYEHDLQSQRETERLTEARLAWLVAVEHEVKLCSKQCEIYVVEFFASRLIAPAYRLSLLAHDSALASLIADGTLSQSASDAIKQFYTDAISFNRGLDVIAELLTKGRTERAPSDELLLVTRDWAHRSVTKALHLVGKDAEQRKAAPAEYQTVVSRLEPALAAIDETRQKLRPLKVTAER
jgi:hypothetical protein